MSGTRHLEDDHPHRLAQTIASVLASQPLEILVKADGGYLQKSTESSLFSEPSDSEHDYKLSLARWPTQKGYHPLALLKWEDTQLVFTSVGGQDTQLTAEALRMLSPNCALTRIAQGVTQYVTSQWLDLSTFGLVPHSLPEGKYRATFDAPYVLGDFEKRFPLVEKLEDVGQSHDCGSVGWFHPTADPTVEWTPFLLPVLAPTTRAANFDGKTQWTVSQVGIDTVSLNGAGVGLFAEKLKGPKLLQFDWNDEDSLHRAIELMTSNDLDELRTLRALVSPDDVKRWGWAARINEQRETAYRGANRRKTRFPLLASEQAFTAARKKVWARKDSLEAWGKVWSVAKTLDEDDSSTRERRTLAMEIMFSHSYATSHEERALQRQFYTELSRTLPNGVTLLRATTTSGKRNVLLVSNERLVHENWAALSMQGDMLSRIIGQAFGDRFPEPPTWHRWDPSHQRWRKHRIS